MAYSFSPAVAFLLRSLFHLFSVSVMSMCLSSQEVLTNVVLLQALPSSLSAPPAKTM